MAFRLPTEKLFTGFVVKPVLNGLEASYAGLSCVRVSTFIKPPMLYGDAFFTSKAPLIIRLMLNIYRQAQRAHKPWIQQTRT